MLLWFMLDIVIFNLKSPMAYKETMKGEKFLLDLHFFPLSFFYVD